MTEAEKQGAPPAGGAVPGDRYAPWHAAVEDLDGWFGPVPDADADSVPGPRAN